MQNNIELPKIAIKSTDFNIVISPSEFRIKLLDSIKNAKNRIYISALYLENDEAGYEVLDALYLAKQQNDKLVVKVFIDFHRAQRGLIGSDNVTGNIKGYYDYKKKYNSEIEIYGVPVKTIEVFGVFHLKGFVIDDTVIYSGASLNNVYLNYNEKFRLDRYFVISSKLLADSFVDFFHRNFLNDNKAVTLFNNDVKVDIKSIKKMAKKFTNQSKKAFYKVNDDDKVSGGSLSVAPIYGLGKNNNKLNNTILKLIKSTTEKLTIYTPYFNLPSEISKEIIYLLENTSVKISIIIGDKTANDFYISPDKEFKKISLIPYLYEQNLLRFVDKYQKHIDSGNLNIFLWKKGVNTFHLKGVEVDDKYRLLTGNNLNPRGWRQDMENGILVSDTNKELVDMFDKEYEYILNDCFRIDSSKSIDSVNIYPPVVKKYIKNIYRTQLHKIVKRLM
ncbi:MAG: CDP-diacylglycerol--serine O-phosphatidyltransferase [Ichthyobacteriaceae bacterium]|nr:CDP-diacylglycerol--serine O-phosphatidyltransferase [Ichthyobacteriaceae bacterium]